MLFSRLKLGTRFTLLLVLFFLISAGLSAVALYQNLQAVAQESVTSNGQLLLHTMNAVRTYTSGQVDPLLAPLMQSQDKFIPESVPAFSARSVFTKLRGDKPYENYAYREAALNPTAPEDRADAWEAQILQRFRDDRAIQELSGFRTLNGQLVFYNARPMAVSSPACLACHSTPETAPPAMVARYGPINGFGWKLNDVVAAQMVYVPAAEVYSRSLNTWVAVVLISIGSFALLVISINIALRRSIVKPIGEMAVLAERISVDDIDERASESLSKVAARSDELGSMAKVFQRMAQEVYTREQALKQQVQELRIEIDEAKKASQVAAVTETEAFQICARRRRSCAGNAGARHLRTLRPRKTARSRRLRETQVASDRMPVVIAIHSFRRGTGKSILAANLAVMLATAGYRAGLIDLDMASPSGQLLFGLGGSAMVRTVNDYLLGLCGIEQAVHDVTGRLGIPGEGRLFLIPSSLNPGQIARVMRQDYDVELLSDAFERLMAGLKLDVLVVDTRAGISYDTLSTLAITDSLAVIVRPDRHDYQGTGVILDLAQQLGVPQATLVVNQVPPPYDLESIRAEVTRTYKCEVAEVLPHSPGLMALASGGIFVLRHPDDPLTGQLWKLANPRSLPVFRGAGIPRDR